jgi:hypothetical protein
MYIKRKRKKEKKKKRNKRRTYNILFRIISSKEIFTIWLSLSLEESQKKEDEGERARRKGN